jgi:hypothetical protein
MNQVFYATKKTGSRTFLVMRNKYSEIRFFTITNSGIALFKQKIKLQAIDSFYKPFIFSDLASLVSGFVNRGLSVRIRSLAFFVAGGLLLRMAF